MPDRVFSWAVAILTSHESNEIRPIQYDIHLLTIRITLGFSYTVFTGFKFGGLYWNEKCAVGSLSQFSSSYEIGRFIILVRLERMRLC